MKSIIEKILSIANSIPDDKVRHALGGAILFTLVAPFDSHVAFAFVVASAVGKELYDYCHSDIHTPDVWDAIATVLGASIGLISFIAGSGWV